MFFPEIYLDAAFIQKIRQTRSQRGESSSDQQNDPKEVELLVRASESESINTVSNIYKPTAATLPFKFPHILAPPQPCSLVFVLLISTGMGF